MPAGLASQPSKPTNQLPRTLTEGIKWVCASALPDPTLLLTSAFLDHTAVRQHRDEFLVPARARTQSKVAAREAARGFAVDREAARLLRFAADEEDDQDMMACAAVGKHGQVGGARQGGAGAGVLCACVPGKV